MAPELALNPPGGEPVFLRGLRESFPGWGGAAEFRWWFRREVGGPPADLLLLVEGGTAIAGTAVCHRLVSGIPGEAGGRVAIMSGAWTAPAHRRRGCFRALVEHARAVAATRGARALLAFASGGRASTPALAAASTAAIDSWGLRGRATASPPAPGRDRVGASASASAGAGAGAPPAARHAPRPSEGALQRWFADRPGAGIVYPGSQVFAVHARLRRAHTAVVAAGPGHWAIVERRRDASPVQAVVSESGPLTEAGWAGALRALHASEPAATAPLLAYTTRRAVADALADAFEPSAANVFVLAVGDSDPRPLAAADWWLHGLDRA